MPVAGVERNPLGQHSDRFHRVPRMVLGRDQSRVLRTTVAEPGTIRRLWRNLAGYLNAGGSADFNWTLNRFETLPDDPRSLVTTPLRYLIDTRDVLTAGNQLSMPIVRPPIVRQRQAPAPPAVYVGNVQGRPTIRNRVVSFGSRVPALNRPSADALEAAQ